MRFLAFLALLASAAAFMQRGKSSEQHDPSTMFLVTAVRSVWCASWGCACTSWAISDDPDLECICHVRLFNS
jgi:hypothetical protein